MALRQNQTLTTIAACLVVGIITSYIPAATPALIFDSPIPAPVLKTYLPIITRNAPSKKGVTLRGGECAVIDLVRATYYHDWGNDWCIGRGLDGYSDMLYSWPDSPSGWDVRGRVVMGANEPNLAGWGNMTPAQGAAQQFYIEQTYPDLYHVSASVSQPTAGVNTCADKGQPCGLQWLWEMIQAFQAAYGRRPHFDAVALHIYTNSGDHLKNYLAGAHAELVEHGYDLPVWITEFGACPFQGRAEWLIDVTDWMNAQPWIARYYWYSSRVPSNECDVNLIRADGSLTEIGAVYASR